MLGKTMSGFCYLFLLAKEEQKKIIKARRNTRACQLPVRSTVDLYTTTYIAPLLRCLIESFLKSGP
jgi:hypothetical protein